MKKFLRNITKTKVFKTFIFQLIVFALSGILCFAVYKGSLSFIKPTAASWPNLSLKSEERSFNINAAMGSPLSFSASDLEFRMGIEKNALKGISITQLPDKASGRLTVDMKEIENYTTLSRKDINKMVFIPTDTAVEAKLTFIPNTKESVTTTVVIKLSYDVNSPPVISGSSIETSRDITICATLPVFDAEQDMIRVEVVSKPQKGEVEFINGAYFTYTPFLGETGADSFKVRCTDSAGSISKAAMVDVRIDTGVNNTYYADMEHNYSHYSAVMLNRNGIFKGDNFGKVSLFYPKRGVERYEFLLTLLSAMGEKNPPACVNTGLTNDNEIPLWLKPYVKLGIDKGIITENSFKPYEIPIRAEAVVMTNRAANVENVSRQQLRIGDIAAVPNWALQAYINLSAYKMLDLYDGKAYPNDALKRDTAADLSWQLAKLCNTAVK